MSILSRLLLKPPIEHGLPFFYGQVVLAVATLGMFMTGPAQTYGVAVFIDPMLGDLDVPRSAISGAYSVASIIAGVSMLVYGHLLDRFSARLVMPVVSLLFGLACMGMALVDGGPGLLIGFTALRVLGVAALMLACSTLAARWFVRQRGRAMSVTMLGMAASNAVFPPLLQALVSAVSWRPAWVLTGLAVWALMIVPTALFVRDRPEAVGLLPDGSPNVANGEGKSQDFTEYTWTFYQAVRSRTFWLLIVASLAPGTVMTGLVFHQVSYFTSRGLSAELAAGVLSVYAVTFAGTTFLVGFALERVPERFVLIGGLLLLPATVLVLMTTETPLQGVVYGALLGLVFGTNATTSSAIWTAYYGRRHLGAIRGVTQSALVLSAATGPLMLSIPYDLTGSYLPGLWLMAAMPLVCALAAALAGPPTPPPGERAELATGK